MLLLAALVVIKQHSQNVKLIVLKIGSVKTVILPLESWTAGISLIRGWREIRWYLNLTMGLIGVDGMRKRESLNLSLDVHLFCSLISIFKILKNNLYLFHVMRAWKMVI